MTELSSNVQIAVIVKLSLSHWYPGQMWCLIVSIPDICPLSHFVMLFFVDTKKDKSRSATGTLHFTK